MLFDTTCVFWLQALVYDNLVFAYFACKVIRLQLRTLPTSAPRLRHARGCLGSATVSPPCFCFSGPNTLAWGHVTLPSPFHTRRGVSSPEPRCDFQITAESLISTFCDDTQGRDCAEKGESSSGRLALATELLSSGCQLRRVNYIEILSEMTDEICLCGLGAELQVIHDMR